MQDIEAAGLMLAKLKARAIVMAGDGATPTIKVVGEIVGALALLAEGLLADAVALDAAAKG